MFTILQLITILKFSFGKDTVGYVLEKFWKFIFVGTLCIAEVTTYIVTHARTHACYLYVVCVHTM